MPRARIADHDMRRSMALLSVARAATIIRSVATAATVTWTDLDLTDSRPRHRRKGPLVAAIQEKRVRLASHIDKALSDSSRPRLGYCGRSICDRPPLLIRWAPSHRSPRGAFSVLQSSAH